MNTASPILPGQERKRATVSASSGGYTFTVSLGFIFALVFSYGAAKLSYARNQSIGWAMLAFLLSGLYYPYYALFLSQTAPVVAPLIGARRR
jgi:hypothetical protein